MRQPDEPLAALLDAHPEIGVLQDATYRPIAKFLFDGCHELPRELAIDLIVQFLRQLHATPLDVEPRIEIKRP
jgi:hypothetical protein